MLLSKKPLTFGTFHRILLYFYYIFCHYSSFYINLAKIFTFSSIGTPVGAPRRFFASTIDFISNT